jgi:beta-phosphoglucomutase-like phosphatase (HAD superfamily)
MELIHDFGAFAAILFDLDGTLADTMPLHNRAWLSALDTFGCTVTTEILFEYTGVPNVQTVEIFNQRFGWTLDPNSVAGLKERLFQEGLPLVQPIVEVLAIAENNFGKLPLAVVSGGIRDTVTKTLATLGCEKLFNTVVCAEDTRDHKPKPEPYLLAARRLGVSPEKCLVYEDGDLGIASAIAAGMRYVKV